MVAAEKPATHQGRKLSDRRRRRQGMAAAASQVVSSPDVEMPMEESAAAALSLQPEASQNKRKRSALMEKYSQKLAGAKFRMLNESLYTTTGQQAMASFTPEEFNLYHQGFANQVNKWPTNPVDVIIKQYLKGRNLIVGDFGCGDARIARETRDRHRVHSFDLVACNAFVIACDIAHVPLEPESLDVAIYSLSLMGVNVGDFIVEANRVLKKGGKLIVAEVKSRFAVLDKGEQGMHHGLEDFYASLSALGFDLHRADIQSNKMFVVLCFVKSERPPVRSTAVSIKACEYKRR